MRIYSKKEFLSGILLFVFGIPFILIEPYGPFAFLFGVCPCVGGSIALINCFDKSVHEKQKNVV